jgi:DnaA family protein
MSGASEQLLLSLRPRPAINFDTFFFDAGNAATLHALREWLQQPKAGVFYLVGAPGSGRSHLLQAACTATEDSIYLPLQELSELDPAPLFEGMEHASLLCLDDIDAVAADRAWNEVLFHCFNRQVGAVTGTTIDNTIGARPGAIGGKWLVSAQVPAAQLPCALPDLGSRLGWGGSYRLAPLDDRGRQRMLQLQAQQRGMVISDELATYILQRYSRDSQALLELLERIDRESLRNKKPISINLVRKLLSHSA